MKTSIFIRKIIFLVLLVLIACAAGWWYVSGIEKPASNPAADPSSEKVNVVVSGYVPYALAREIGGDYVNITMLVAPGTEPHHFEPTPGAIIAVQKAALFVYVSARIEPWTKDILGGLSNVKSVASGPSDEEQDPHIWMTPYGALSMAKRIASALIKIDPAHKRAYKENLARFEAQMQQLHTDFASGLAHCKSRDLVHVGHLAFGTLADTYGLNLHALSGSSHQGEHSVYKLTNMVRFIQKQKLTAVFTEEMISPQLARTVAQETRVKLLPLYTIEEVSKEDFANQITYQEYMRRNLKNLQEGLRCQV